MKQKKVETVMTTRLMKVAPETPLSEAYKIIQDNSIRHLPVVNEADHVIGIISERDFERAKISGIGPTAVIRRQVRFPSAARVRDYMTEKLYSLSAHDDINVSIDVMLENKISSCLILNGDEVVGIVTTDDLLRLLQRFLKNPKGSLRMQLEAMIKLSPLGAIGDALSGVGI
jgi:acetoin utilization protein AcuB